MLLSQLKKYIFRTQNYYGKILAKTLPVCNLDHRLCDEHTRFRAHVSQDTSINVHGCATHISKVTPPPLLPCRYGPKSPSNPPLQEVNVVSID